MADLKETDEPVEKAGPTRKPTIYAALRTKLGREPTHNELKADVRRILSDGTAERAAAGKLSFQRRSRAPRIRKSSDPLTALYAEIEKAKPLLRRAGANSTRPKGTRLGDFGPRHGSVALVPRKGKRALLQLAGDKLYSFDMGDPKQRGAGKTKLGEFRRKNYK